MMHKAAATSSVGNIRLISSQRTQRPTPPSVRCSKNSSRAAKTGKPKQQKQRSKAAPHKPRQAAHTCAQTLTAPLQVKVEAQLSKLEQAANPWWSTFCGVTNGLWLGQTAAFAPSSGQPEAVAKSSDGKPVLDLFTHCTEDRVCEGPKDYVLRHTVEADVEADLGSLAHSASMSDPEAEEVHANEEGMVFFDGGSYSRGPLTFADGLSHDEAVLNSPEEAKAPETPQGNDAWLTSMQNGNEPGEEDGAEPASADVGGSRGPPGDARVVTVEQCLTWGGEQRKRCRLTFAVSGGGDTGEELDILLLHIRLFHENWQGMLQELTATALRANSAVPSSTAQPSLQETAPAASSLQQAGTSEAASHLQAASSQQPAASSESANSAHLHEAAQQAAVKFAVASQAQEIETQDEARVQSGTPASSSFARDSATEPSSGTVPESFSAQTSWNGTAGAGAGAGAGAILGQPLRASLSKGSCISSQQIEGSWKVFDMAAVPIDETDPDTGITRKAMVYFSQETQQRWTAASEGPSSSQEEEDEEGAADGGALWLPGDVLLEVQMLPMVSRGAVADKVEGISTSNTGRGVLLTFSWLVRPGMMISMQREYDAAGDLMEVRSRSAVEGSWVGGRM